MGNMGFCSPSRMIISLDALEYSGAHDWAGGRESMESRL